MTYAWILWDLFALVLLIILVHRCAAKGLLRTIISLLGYFVSTLVAGALSTPLAKLLYDNIVEDALRLVITRHMEERIAEGAAMVTELLETIPDTLQRLMSAQTGIDIPATIFEGDSSVIVDLVIRDALQEPVISVLRSLCFFVIFSIALLVVRYVSRMFTGVYRIPVLGSVNTFLGGVVGVAEGIIAIYLIAIVLRVVVLLTGGGLEWLNDSVMDSTFIFRTFYMNS